VSAKRVAPGTFEKRSIGLEGRQKRASVSVAPPGLARFLSVIQGQRARCARTGPWLPYSAPPALRTHRAPPARTSLILVGNMVVRAPQARQMVARGEREARNPWNVRKKKYRPGRPTETGQRVCRPCGARALFICDPGAACSLRSHWPLATLFRASGAPPSGYRLPRLRRFGTHRAPPARTTLIPVGSVSRHGREHCR
jgi:hypothetical protein